MNSLNLSSSQLAKSFPNFISKGYDTLSSWGGHLLKIIQPAVQPLAENMQKNSKVAIAVFTIANLLFLPAIHYLTRLKSENETDTNLLVRTIRPIFVEVVLVGGGVFAFNALLSKVTAYRLSRRKLTWITIAALSFRFVCRKLFIPSDPAKEPVATNKAPPTNPRNPPSPTQIQNPTKPQPKPDTPDKNIKSFADYIRSINYDESGEEEYCKQFESFESLPEDIKIHKLDFLFAKSLNNYNKHVKTQNNNLSIPASAREKTIKACINSFINRKKLQKRIFSNMYSRLSKKEIRQYKARGVSKNESIN